MEIVFPHWLKEEVRVNDFILQLEGDFFDLSLPWHRECREGMRMGVNVEALVNLTQHKPVFIREKGVLT